MADEREAEARIAELEEQLARERARADEAVRARGAFLGNVSHEVRTPINAIVGYSDLLAASDLDSERWRMVSSIRGAACELLGLFSQLVDAAQIEGGHIELEQAPFSVRLATRDVVESMREEAEGRGLELALHIGADVPQLAVGDAERYSQVVAALLDNAIRYTPSGAVSLLLEASAVSDERIEITLSVLDTGVGIAAVHHARIFEPFRQVDESASRGHGGLGLGLSISRAVVNAMGGTIRVESEPNNGSMFVVKVPLVVAAVEATDQPRVTGLQVTPRPGRWIALVDDSSDLEIWRAALRPFGVQIDAVATVARAIECAREHEPLLLLADVALASRRELEEAAQEIAAFLPYRLPMVALLPAPEAGAQVPRGYSPARKPVCAARIIEIAARYAANTRKSLTALAGRLRVLLAEDSPVNRSLACSALGQQGFDVVAVEDGARAIELLDGDPQIDVVLMDMQMPVLDGYRATRVIRADTRFATVPVVAATANAMRGDEERCLAAGCDAYLSKPIVWSRAAAVLRRCVEKRRAQSARARSSGGLVVGVTVRDWSEASAAAVQREEPAAAGGDWREELSLDVLMRKTTLTPQQLHALLPELQSYVCEQLERIEQCRQTPEQASELSRIAHALKGSLGTFGFVEVSRLARRVEHDIGDEAVDELATALHAVSTLAEQARLEAAS